MDIEKIKELFPNHRYGGELSVWGLENYPGRKEGLQGQSIKTLCLSGTLLEDQQGRFIDNFPIDTSYVRGIEVFDNDIFAITKNSIYRLLGHTELVLDNGDFVNMTCYHE